MKNISLVIVAALALLVAMALTAVLAQQPASEAKKAPNTSNAVSVVLGSASVSVTGGDGKSCSIYFVNGLFDGSSCHPTGWQGTSAYAGETK